MGPTETRTWKLVQPTAGIYTFLSVPVFLCPSKSEYNLAAWKQITISVLRNMQPLLSIVYSDCKSNLVVVCWASRASG